MKSFEKNVAQISFKAEKGDVKRIQFARKFKREKIAVFQNDEKRTAM